MTDGSNPNANPGGEGSPNAGGEGEKGQNVSYETYKKSVDAEKALKKQVKEMQEKLSGFETKESSAEEARLLANNEHLKVIDGLKKQNEELLAKTAEFEKGFSDIRKTSVVMQAFAQKGITVDSKYANLIDLESIEIGADDKPVMASVNKVVEAFQKEHPALAKPLKPGMPGGNTNYSASKGPISKEEWEKLPKAEQKERWKDVKR